MSDTTEQDDLIEIELDDVQDNIKIETKTDSKEPEPEPKPEPAEKEDDQSSVVAELRRQLEDERRARAEADSRAQTALSTAQDSNYTTIVNAIAARETVMVQLEAELASAIETGDGARAAKLQRRINAVDIELDKLNSGKAYLEDQSRQGRTEGRVEPQPQPQKREMPRDRKEEILQTVHPRSADWLRRHPDCLDDPAKNARMMAAHYEAVAENIEPNSDAYFAHIETKLGYRQPARKEPEVQKDPPPRQQQRDVVPAAPAARDMNGGSRMTVTLTREERETAESLGIDLKDYARNKLALIREGQLKG